MMLTHVALYVAITFLLVSYGESRLKVKFEKGRISVKHVYDYEYSIYTAYNNERNGKEVVAKSITAERELITDCQSGIKELLCVNGSTPICLANGVILCTTDLRTTVLGCKRSPVDRCVTLQRKCVEGPNAHISDCLRRGPNNRLYFPCLTIGRVPDFRSPSLLKSYQSLGIGDNSPPNFPFFDLGTSLNAQPPNRPKRQASFTFDHIQPTVVNHVPQEQIIKQFSLMIEELKRQGQITAQDAAKLEPALKSLATLDPNAKPEDVFKSLGALSILATIVPYKDVCVTSYAKPKKIK